MREEIKNTKWLLGGFQEHQNWKDDGICTTLTAAMGMGGGYVPVILQIKTKSGRNFPLVTEN